MTDIWQWIYDRRYDAYEQNDQTRLDMVNLFWQMMDHMESDPNLSLQYGAQARRLADLVGDLWFVQLINHWELQIRYSFLGDYTGTVDLATKATVEVRLPEYQNFPQRICLHEDLITAYFEQDPVGNRDLVQQALDYMEKEVNPDVECYQCLYGLKIDFLRIHNTPDVALEMAKKALTVVENSPHHLSFTYLSMVEVAYEQRDWDKLHQWAQEAENNSRQSDRDNLLATTLLWLATYHYHIQQKGEAESLYNQATHRAKRYGAFIGQSYYLALTAYYEITGQLEDALGAQQEYLTEITGKSKPFQECLAGLEIIRLKKALNQPYDADVQTLHESVKALKSPDYILGKLKEITD